MPRVTFETVPVVCVTIKGEGEDGVPRVREDGGLVQRFLKFQLDENIHPAVRGGYSGAGSFCGFFSAEDVEKIEKWLFEQGAEHNE